MSSIIKGGRIRSQGTINLSERVPKVQAVYEERNTSSDEKPKEEYVTTVSLEERREELEKLEEKIKTRLEEARRQESKILEEAQQKAEQLEEEGRKKKEALISEGSSLQQNMIRMCEEEVQKTRQQALEEKQQLLEGTEDEVVETMTTLLKHIISDEYEHNVDWMKMVVHKMLLRCENEEEMKVYFSPEQYQKIADQKELWCRELKKLSAIEADDSLNNTTCKLETSQGNIIYDMNQGMEKVISEIRILKGLS